MTMSARQAGNNSGQSAIATIGLIAISALLIPLIIQNWEPAVVVYFLGQKTYAVPFSLVMFAALISGGVVTFLINLISQPKLNSTRNFGNSSAQIPNTSASSSDSRYQEEDFDQLDDFDDDDRDDYIEVKYTKK